MCWDVFEINVKNKKGVSLHWCERSSMRVIQPVVSPLAEFCVL